MSRHDYIDDHTLRVGEQELVYGMRRPATATTDRPWIFKPRLLIDQYIELVERLRPRRMVEIGIHSGGSTALLAALAEPERLVALELSDERVPALDRFVETHGVHDSVHAHYGVDQADRAAVAAIVHREFAGEPIDVVIDDASHLYDPTVASFEVLFPLVRPGGSYVIEDWSTQDQLSHQIAQSIEDTSADDWADRVEWIATGIRTALEDVAGPEAARRAEAEFRASPTIEAFVRANQDRAPLTNERPLSRLPLELTLARAERSGIVESVAVTGGWVEVVRGGETIDPRGFTLGSIYRDYYGQVSARASTTGAMSRKKSPPKLT